MEAARMGGRKTVRRTWHQNFQRASAADRTSAEGLVFDSKAELARWGELQMMQRAGEIHDLQRQMLFPLAFNGRAVKIRSKGFPNGRACVYTVDFSYTDGHGKPVYEEHKGHDTSESRLRRAVVEALYQIEIIVTGPAAVNTPRMPDLGMPQAAAPTQNRIGRRSGVK